MTGFPAFRQGCHCIQPRSQSLGSKSRLPWSTRLTKAGGGGFTILILYPPSGPADKDAKSKKDKKMCRAPSYIWIQKGPSWEQQPVNCKICWQCLGNRVNDYVGRSLCEASTSQGTMCVTLTYRPRDDLADKVLTPLHFQNFMRSLRKAGHVVRYIVAGEYGELKGRAHFHVILFFQTPMPEIPHKENFHWGHWPHGHVFADLSSDEATLRYAMKYLTKEERGSYWFSLSKKPSIGSEYFRMRAAENVRHGVFPSSFEYLPPGGDRGRPYLLTGATRRDYLANILAPFQFGPDQEVPERFNEWVYKAIKKVRVWQRLSAARVSPEEAMQQLADELDLKRPKVRTHSAMMLDTAEYLFDTIDEIHLQGT